MIKRRSLQDVSFLWAGSFLGALAAFFIQVILARELSVSDYGTFATILAIIALLVPLVGFGVSQFWLKVFGKEGYLAQRWLKGSFNFIFLSILLVVALVILWSYQIEENQIFSSLVLIMLIFLLSQVTIELTSVRLQLEERYLALAIWQFFPHLARLFLIALASFGIIFSIELFIVVWIFAAIGLIVICIGTKMLFNMLQGRWKLKGHNVQHAMDLHKDSPNYFSVIQNSWPFGLAAFFHIIYYQSDVIFLKYMVGEESAGLYNVAFSVMAAVYLLPGVIYQKYLLPKIHRWANHDKYKFYDVYLFGNKAMLILGLLGMFGI
jgi:O-antigen/teichoic acid export membrane protein